VTEKEMVSHIKSLTRIIEKQEAHTDNLIRNFSTVHRQISYLVARISKLEGIKPKEF
jgi:hypothetical protein